MQTKQDASQKKNEPLISFIIPYYNVPAELLRDSLESIINLSLSDDEYEIILIDDGSDISPKEIISKYKNIRYISFIFCKIKLEHTKKDQKSCKITHVLSNVTIFFTNRHMFSNIYTHILFIDKNIPTLGNV